MGGVTPEWVNSQTNLADYLKFARFLLDHLQIVLFSEHWETKHQPSMFRPITNVDLPSSTHGCRTGSGHSCIPSI
jgi:hypothetical protein